MSVVTASLLPEPAPRRHDEADLQRSVHQYLRWALPHDAVHFAIPNGLMRGRKAAARASGEGVRAGVPDLAVIHQGRTLFFELKTDRGRLSAVQRQVHERLTHAGALVFTCCSLLEVEAQLKAAHVPLAARIGGAP
jgi:hypothetical protein